MLMQSDAVPGDYKQKKHVQHYQEKLAFTFEVAIFIIITNATRISTHSKYVLIFKSAPQCLSQPLDLIIQH